MVKEVGGWIKSNSNDAKEFKDPSEQVKLPRREGKMSKMHSNLLDT